MPLSDIILSAGEVLVYESGSTSGVIPVDGKVAFGVVALVSDVSDKVSAGVSVMYNPQSARKISYGSTIYFIINESDISGTEVAVP